MLSTLLVAVLALVTSGRGQTTLKDETANNTSACSGAANHCKGAFNGMSDSASGTFNAAPGNVSREDMHELEYSGATTALYAHFLPWFCMQPGSTATGPGTSCNSHLQVGYNSNDPATVKAQMDDMQARGFKGPIVDWYGPNRTLEEQTTQLVKQDLEGRCSGGVCEMQFALMEDQGSFTRTCPQNGNGVDQTQCITAALQRDLDYMNANYFGSAAYLRVDANTMRPSIQGRPAVFFFICEPCFTNPAPNWTYIYTQLRAHVQSYTNGDPLIWFIFRNSIAFTHVESDGGFAWVNHYGSNDPYGLVYLDNFYDVSLKYQTKQAWGATWKGFDNTLAPWKPAVSVTPQQCGNTWVQTWAEMTHNNDYSSARQLPFLQVVTWNDYEEGSAIEAGIDNCLSLTASTEGSNLSWTPAFSSSSGSEATVHHYEVFDSTDGQALTRVATVAAGSNAVPLNSLNLTRANHTFYVKAVGKASILNKMSNAVTYSNLPNLAVSSVTPNSGSTAGGTSVNIAGQGFADGVTVTFGGATATVSTISATTVSVVTPANTAGTVDVVVTNPDGTSATANGAYAYVAPAEPGFTLSASPNSKTVNRESNATYNISVTPNNGFTGALAFSVTGLPSGATASFSPSSITTSGTTKLSIGTRNTVRGKYTLTVVARNSTGTISSSVKMSLTIR